MTGVIRAERRSAYVDGFTAGRAGEMSVPVPVRFVIAEELEFAWYCGRVDGYNRPLGEACNPYIAGFDYD